MSRTPHVIGLNFFSFFTLCHIVKAKLIIFLPKLALLLDFSISLNMSTFLQVTQAWSSQCFLTSFFSKLTILHHSNAQMSFILISFCFLPFVLYIHMCVCFTFTSQYFKLEFRFNTYKLMQLKKIWVILTDITLIKKEQRQYHGRMYDFR